MTRAAVRTAAALAALVLTACSATVPGHGRNGRSSSAEPSPVSSPPGPTAPVSSAALPAACTHYAAPDPDRPKMTLHFTIAADHRTVTGHEQVVFRPDLPVTELVFRLTANTKPTVAAGNKIVVTAATADHGAGAYRFSRANAAPSTQGGLLRLPFGHALAAGTVVTASIDFVVTLGAARFDRFGRAGDYAYFGSAEPLLAWERGFGWHAEDMLGFLAESATSEAMDVDLSVTAPSKDVVIMSGDPTDPPAGGATRTWHATIGTARDVSVAAGPFQVSDATVQGVRLRVGAPDPDTRDLLVTEFHRAITQLAARFGPYPFPSLSVARLPVQGGGIEYPSSILLLDSSPIVVVHETAHQWFYAMVGDSQALHPWLDEAFATYAEELVNHDRPDDHGLDDPKPVDASAESYATNADSYYFVTYNKGADALFAARAAAGPARFDAALRCYVAANAWRIADPSDLQAALAELPAAIATLRGAGALR